MPLNEKGVCTAFCSKYGFCGESGGYKAHGHDCSGCAGKHAFYYFLVTLFPIKLNSITSAIYFIRIQIF